jgi:PAS domain S-box-containing protein
MRQSLEDRLAFETLLADISAQFVNLPADQIDGVIEDAQRRICQCLGFDLSGLWQWSEGQTHRLMTLTHLFSPPDGPVRPDEPLDAAKAYPWYLERILRGEVIACSTADLPPEAAIDKESQLFYGIEFTISGPLSVGGGAILGVLSFNSLRSRRRWSEPLLNRFKLISQIFANALARKRQEEALRESQMRLKLASDAGQVGLWEFDLQTRCLWVSDKAREIFGYPHGECISAARFEASVEPEDLGLIRHALAEGVDGSTRVDVVYRIRTDSGELKWICSRGIAHVPSAGKPVRIVGASIDISERKNMENALSAQLKEIERLKLLLETENAYLREDLIREKGFEKIVWESKGFQAALFSARQVASTNATVLLLGETGTGKGLLANAIHQMSGRKDQAMVTVNCSALPYHLIESELFGREKGAFTGAVDRQIGRFEVADRGTLFLDEIGDLPLELQPKLLRVLQDGEFERLGSSRSVKVDVRVIAATSRDLTKEVQEGRFRKDLFYRLLVFPITIPPLKQRTEDIPLLAHHFLEKYAQKYNKQLKRIPDDVIKTLVEHDWPGNARELEHVIERGVIMASGPSLRMTCRFAPTPLDGSTSDTPKDLATAEREHILKVLQKTGWQIEGPAGAASILKLHPSTLRFRIKKLGIRRPV